MAADIAHLKLYQLAIPGAHNSGVDEDGDFHIGENWAVCQYNDFSSQLAAGARYLDVRLVDSSYKKDVGGKKPTYQFKEIFEFKHGIVSVGRRLSGLVSAVYNFSTENPGEIVIIDFHHYDKGRNYAHTSLQRCLPYFNSIQDAIASQARANSIFRSLCYCVTSLIPVGCGLAQDRRLMLSRCISVRTGPRRRHRQQARSDGIGDCA